MTDRDSQGMGNPEQWDWENAERRPPVKARRAVVSVAFQRSDLDRVASCAERRGMSVSRLIREAALEKAAREGEFIPLGWSAGNLASAFFSDVQMLVSGTSSAVIEEAQEVVTS